MKRLTIASVLVVGALFLFFAGSPTTTSAQLANYCVSENVQLPDTGPFHNFSDPCLGHAKCWGSAGDQLDLLLCDQDFLLGMINQCNGVFPAAQAAPPSSPFVKAVCRQIAYKYYYAARIASAFYVIVELEEEVP